MELIIILYLLQVVSKNNLEMIDLINNVETFYNNSLNRVLWIVGIFFTVFAILVPVILNWIQKRQYQLDKKELKNYIEDRLALLENRIDKKIEEKLMQEKENIENQSELKLLQLEGKLHKSLAQNYNFFDDTVITTILDDYMGIALPHYILSALKFTEANNIEKSHEMLIKVIDELERTHEDKDKFNKIDQELLRRLIKKLEEHNSHYQYSTYLEKLNKYI